MAGTTIPGDHGDLPVYLATPATSASTQTPGRSSAACPLPQAGFRGHSR